MAPSKSRNLRVRPRFVLITLAAAAVVAAIGLTTLEPRAPSVTWAFGNGTEQHTVEPFGSVPRWDDMAVEVSLPWPAYVYVVAFDYQRGTVTYFPSEFLGTDYRDAVTGRMNHFPAGNHRIPGQWQGTALKWFVPDVAETVSLCTVVSREPLEKLETTLKLTRQAGNTAFPDKSMGLYMPRAGRDKVIGKRRMPHDVLLAAQNQRGSIAPGPMARWDRDGGVWLKVLNIVPGKPRPGREMPGSQFMKQLGSMLDKKQQEAAGKPSGQSPVGSNAK
ncbi:MAG: hypothetical protein KDC87_14355 [Planctomycetes bacterium]|nr:hypothetical protein [Planctomycetota bacterium]